MKRHDAKLFSKKEQLQHIKRSIEIFQDVHHVNCDLELSLSLHKVRDALGQLDIPRGHQTAGSNQSASRRGKFQMFYIIS